MCLCLDGHMKVGCLHVAEVQCASTGLFRLIQGLWWRDWQELAASVL